VSVGEWNASWCAAFVAELVEQGVRHAVVAPGSRSGPLAVALVRDGGVDVQVVLDERSAAFRALGIGRATRRPAVVLSTSGTAATHFHAAVAEAHHGRVPMIVCTADRPPELQNIGAAQTIDQQQLYGSAVRWFCDPGPPSRDSSSEWSRLGVKAVRAATSIPPGPVHLNLPFREPLLPARDATALFRRTSTTVVKTDDETPHAPEDVVELVNSARRPLLVCGWGSDEAHDAVVALHDRTRWPVLADAISNVRTGPHAIAHYEALLRAPGFADAHRPDVVVHIGGPLTSKTATQWLDASIPHVLVDPSGWWLDPERAARHRVACAPATMLDAVAAPVADDWSAAWRRADDAAEAAIDAAAAGEPRAVREVWRTRPDGAQLLVASSMPVRDLEWFAPARRGVTAHANRGVNGIDGLVSTTLGIAVGSGAPTVAILGDLALLHDAGGLLGAVGINVDCAFVVLDNHGGGIFSFLPQADPDVSSPAEFEQLFGTPQDVDVGRVLAAYGVPVVEASAEEVGDALRGDGVRAVVVRSDRVQNVADHRALWAAVAACV
jgi:2-succinyl-5-enolpyruvyl-6-hydroxy-3-cyclohexene-1-carboxylate synthase